MQTATIKTLSSPLTIDTHREVQQDLEDTSQGTGIQTQVIDHPVDVLGRLADLLRNYGGTVDVSAVDLPDGMKKHSLLYQRDSDWPVTYPVSNETEFCIEYDDLLKTWRQTGRLFGLLVNDSMNPESFLHSLVNRAHAKLAPRRAFFGFAIKYAERYTGDHRLMLYKLGIELVAIGSMMLSTGPESPIIAVWSSESDPDFKVYFSVQNTPISEKLLFGFYPEEATHSFLADPNGFLGVLQLMDEYDSRLKDFSHQCSLRVEQ